MVSVSRMAEIFQQSGIFMYPLVAVFVIGIAIAIERHLFLSGIRQTSRSVWESITPYLRAGKFQDALSMMPASQSVISRILGYGLDRIRASATREEIADALDESLLEILPLLEKRTHFLPTLTNAAAMIGLLGTVYGLIDLFAAVAAVESTGQTNMLLASLPMVMSPMAFGLTVAVLLFLLHGYPQNRTDAIIENLEIVTVKFLNTVEERRSLARAAGLAT